MYTPTKFKKKEKERWNWRKQFSTTWSWLHIVLVCGSVLMACAYMEIDRSKIGAPRDLSGTVPGIHCETTNGKWADCIHTTHSGEVWNCVRWGGIEGTPIYCFPLNGSTRYEQYPYRKEHTFRTSSKHMR